MLSTSLFVLAAIGTNSTSGRFIFDLQTHYIKDLKDNLFSILYQVDSFAFEGAGKLMDEFTWRVEIPQWTAAVKRLRPPHKLEV